MTRNRSENWVDTCLVADRLKHAGLVHVVMLGHARVDRGSNSAQDREIRCAAANCGLVSMLKQAKIHKKGDL